MPLNPEISLAGRPIDIKAPDPLTTLLGVAQYQNLQGQAALRDLQMQQVRQGLAEYQRIQGPLRELQALQQGQVSPQAGGAPGPSPVAQLGALPPSAYAQASGQPATQASMIPPALPGTSYVQAPGAAPNAAMNQLSPATQAPPGTTYAAASPAQQPPGLGLSPGAGADIRNMVGIQRVDAPNQGQQPSVPGLAQGGGPPPGPAAPPAASSGAPGFQVPSPDALQRRLQVYRNLMAAGPTIGVPIAKEYMDMDVRELGLRKDALALQQEQLQKANEVLAGITDQTSYDEAKRVLAATGSPEVAQWGPNFDDPTTQARLAYRKAIAQTQQQRVDAQLKAAQQNIDLFGKQVELAGKQVDFFGKQTERMKEGREATEVFPTPTASGINITQKFGGQTRPMPGPGGGVALPPNQADVQEYYDAQGNLLLGRKAVPPGQRPQVQRPVMPQQVPGYAVPQGGTAPATGGTATAPSGPQSTQLMNQEAVQKNLDVGRNAQTDQLKAASTQAEQARNSLDTLDQMKALMHQGYYDDLFAKNLANPEAQKAMIAAGRDPQRIANTYKIQNLANQLVIAEQGGRGLRVGPTEIGKLTGAAGQLEQIPPKASALQMVEELRQAAKKQLTHYNELAGAQPTKMYQYPIKPTISQADFAKRYQALKAANPNLTMDQVALEYERAGYHVEGAYE